MGSTRLFLVGQLGLSRKEYALDHSSQSHLSRRAIFLISSEMHLYVIVRCTFGQQPLSVVAGVKEGMGRCIGRAFSQGHQLLQDHRLWVSSGQGLLLPADVHEVL
ncbi:uncharacterized [Tachysurus ichikawai]